MSSKQALGFDPGPMLLGHILRLEQESRVSRTFRRLDPERQQRILVAILEEAIERGPTALNIKEVARRGGVSIGSLYDYFGSREGLLDFTIELCVRVMSESLAAYGPTLAAMPLREALSAYVLGGVEWSKGLSGLVAFFARAAYHGDPALTERVVDPVAEAMRSVVGLILDAAAARGELRRDLDREALTRVVNGLLTAFGDCLLLPYLDHYFGFAGPGRSPQEALGTLLEVVLAGITATPARKAIAR